MAGITLDDIVRRDTSINRQAALSRGIIPVIPHKANEKGKPAFFAKALYRG